MSGPHLLVATMIKKQQFFEAEFKNKLDFTPGDQLEYKYKDPATEEKWRTWSSCWDALSGRFQRRIDSLDGLFDDEPANQQTSTITPCSSTTTLPPTQLA